MPLSKFLRESKGLSQAVDLARADQKRALEQAERKGRPEPRWPAKGRPRGTALRAAVTSAGPRRWSAPMPRYFFDLWEGDVRNEDDTGVELDSLAVAKAEVARTLAEIAREKAPGHDRRQFGIVVRDEHGVRLVRAMLVVAVRDA